MSRPASYLSFTVLQLSRRSFVEVSLPSHACHFITPSYEMKEIALVTSYILILQVMLEKLFDWKVNNNNGSNIKKCICINRIPWISRFSCTAHLSTGCG